MAKKKWTKFRHKIITRLAHFVISPIARAKYNVKIERFKEKDKKQYLILYNHQTAFDQFFVEMVFKRSVYYVASEDLFSNGFVSKLLKYAVAPIPIKKQTTDMRSVMDCVRVAKEGGTIAIAPEGNRTYSGQTEYFKEAIVKLARLVNLPLAFMRIEGGYGVQPRWSDVTRKGKMRAYVSKVVYPEEYKKLSETEMYNLIKQELYVNESCDCGEFIHKKSAEYIERTLYVCPKCGLSEFKSKGDRFSCLKCGMEVTYSPNKQLISADKEFKFNFIGEWYDYQCEFVNNLDLLNMTDKPLFIDTANVFDVKLYHSKKRIYKNARLSLYGDKITVTNNGKVELILEFDVISGASVLGKNKLNVYYKDNVYQIKGGKRLNTLKYVNLYYRYKNIKEKDNGKFLGL